MKLISIGGTTSISGLIPNQRHSSINPVNRVKDARFIKKENPDLPPKKKEPVEPKKNNFEKLLKKELDKK